MILKSNKITGFLHKPKFKGAQGPQKSSTATEELSQQEAEGLPRPGAIPELVGEYLVSEMKMDPDLVPFLMSVTRKSSKGEKAFDIRIYDEPETLIKKVTVKNYNTLDEHPELIFYEGWFDNESKSVEGKARRGIAQTPIFTEAEMLQKIEALTEPGSTVSFFTTRGPNLGGPLGRGAFIVELNPDYPKHGKKYNGYPVNAFGLELAEKGHKLWDSNKPKDIAKWLGDTHRKRAF